MICDSCAAAADLGSLGLAAHVAVGCLGSTWCTCQHRTDRSRVDSSVIENRSPDQGKQVNDSHGV
jgi:hypothetical protein